MRKVFFAGAAAAVVYLVVNRAMLLLNARSDLAVTAGYFLLLTVLAIGVGYGGRLWRRL
jgi:hypothetical protein